MCCEIVTCEIVCVSVCLSLSLSLSVYLSVSVYLPVCLPIFLSVCLFVSLCGVDVGVHYERVLRIVSVYLNSQWISNLHNTQ